MMNKYEKNDSSFRLFLIQLSGKRLASIAVIILMLVYLTGIFIGTL